jgi:hypothetical protein
LPDVTVDLSVERVTGLLVDGDGEDASAARARRHRVAPKKVAQTGMPRSIPERKKGSDHGSGGSTRPGQG